MKHLQIKIHEAPVFVFFQVIVEVIISDMVWGLVIAFSHFEDEFPLTENFTFSEGFFLLFLLFQIFMMGYIFLSWIRNYYWFEGGVLFRHKGIIFTNIDEYLLSELETVHLKQGVFGKIFDFGNIKLIFPQKTIILKHFPHPHIVLENIQKLRGRI